MFCYEVWCHMTAFTIHLRLQSTSAKCCRLTITNMLSSVIWFAVIGLWPDRKERPQVTEIFLNKQLPFHPNWKWQQLFTSSVMTEWFWSHCSSTPFYLPSTFPLQKWQFEKKKDTKMYISCICCHSKKPQTGRENSDEKISDLRRNRHPNYENAW